MAADWKHELAGLRDNLPTQDEGVFKGSKQLTEPVPENQEEVLPNIEFPPQSSFYITFAYNYDIDPEIRKLYPQGKQQYLNAMLRSVEAGQNPWPEPITNRQEALGLVSEDDIKQWFESSGRQGILAAGYSDPEKYLREILQQEPADDAGGGPAILSEKKAEKQDELITDPDQGESQTNYFLTRSVLRDEALRGRLVKNRVPESAQVVRPQHVLREDQTDFTGSKGMKRQEEAANASGIIVNIGTGPREESPQERQARGAKFNKKLGIFVHRDYSPANYKRPSERRLEMEPGTEAWLRDKAEGGDSGLKISGELAERVGEVKFDWSGVEAGRDSIFVSFTGKVENKNTGRLEDRGVYVAFNLSREAIAAAKAGERQTIEQAAKECVVKNQGVPFVQIAYDSSSGTIFFGLGQRNQPEIGVQLSPEGLRKVAGKRSDEVLEYLDRRSREFSTLDYEKEKEPMWEFDKFLLEQYVPGQNKKLKQLVWDEAFRQIWEKSVGPEKLEQLRAQALQMPPEQDEIPGTDSERPLERARSRVDTNHPVRNPAKNRWLVSPDIGKQGDVMQPKNNFFKLINQTFANDYRKFLEAGKFREFANEAELSAPEAINLAAEKILLESGRTEDYREFQRFAELPREEQAKFLVQNGLRVGSEHTFGLLFKRLYLFVSGGQGEQSDSSNAGEGFVKGRTSGRQTGTAEKGIAPTVQAERRPTVRDNHSDVLAKILARAEKRANSRPYNLEDDPEIQAGII